MKRLLISAATILGAMLFFYLGFVSYLDQYHVGITWNPFSGEIKLEERTGFHITEPWVLVARVDTRPMRVCITSSARGYNCRLAQFEKSAYREFVAVQGWEYYWLANRISWNSGYSEEYRGMKDIMRGYAFGAKQYPFIKILEEYEESSR